ncbi:hypothetical protein MM213_00055 [Belliella sp. R4-6]|uniref:Uncharacterized protein n=1 Tax=Belliella alkalica TaxID=1730871 RepID=A0ABS9V610_9BACT|nr:hypothetical protein [Belliella alkalica]MCH7411860.1 hypothetical protein [Belliella alkalica]
MKTPNYHPMLLLRYEACKFNFDSFENDQFTYSIDHQDYSFSDESVSFTAKEGQEVLKSISLNDLFEISREYPKFHVDYEFLINPVTEFSHYWKDSFVDFLRLKEKEMGFEVACSLRRLVAASRRLEKIKSIYDLKLYQALFIICESGTDSLKAVSGECFQEALQFLNNHKIYIIGQSNATEIWSRTKISRALPKKQKKETKNNK